MELPILGMMETLVDNDKKQQPFNGAVCVLDADCRLAPNDLLLFVFRCDDVRDLDLIVKQDDPHNVMLLIVVDQALTLHDLHGGHITGLVMDNRQRGQMLGQRLRWIRPHNRRSRTQQNQNQGEFEHGLSPEDVSDKQLHKAVARCGARIEQSHHAVAPAFETAKSRQFQRTGGT